MESAHTTDPPPAAPAYVGPASIPPGTSRSDAEDFFANNARAKAYHHYTYRHLDSRGRTTAWQAACEWADALLPLADKDSRFPKRYGAIKQEYEAAVKGGKVPDAVIEWLHYACALEMKAQGRLGRATLPVSEHNPLLDGIR